MLTKSQKELLKSVGRTKNHPDFGKPNPQLDQVILKLKLDNPHAFLMDTDLDDRVFLDEPKDQRVRMAGFIYPIEERKL